MAPPYPGGSSRPGGAVASLGAGFVLALVSLM